MQPESGELKPRLSLTNTLQPVCYQQRHTQIPRQPGVSLQSIRGFCSVFDVKQLLSWSVQTAEFLCQCLTSSLWTGCGGSAPGSSSVSWCRTQTASSGRLPRANRGPPHSWGPSGSTHKAQGPGCSSPQPHLNTTQHMIITAGYRQSLIWLLQSVTGYPESTQDCETVSLSSHMLMETLTVKHSEDFLHHLPQDEDVGLSVWWSSRFPVLAVLTQFAEIAFLVFGMGIRCGHVLQTWHPWSQTIQVLS